MAKIIKIGSQNLTPNKIANPFKTSRTSTTNPFKYNNFEGNTLPFEVAADVFQGTKAKSVDKLRMIASSVTGSMNKMRSSIAEPIVNFVNRVRGGISHAWDYTKNTAVYKKMDEILNTEIELNIPKPSFKGITDSMSSIKDGISSRMSYLNKDILEVGKDMKTQWDALIAKIPSRRNYSTMSVAELEVALREELALLGGV